jgi:hypothetical protein
MSIVVSGLDDIVTIRDEDNIDSSLPSKGVHGDGPGIGQPISDVPGGTGWTWQRHSIERHEDGEQYAITVDAQFEAGGGTRLTGTALAAYARRHGDWPPGWENRREHRVPPGQAKK